jgi:hypothetical protein
MCLQGGLEEDEKRVSIVAFVFPFFLLFSARLFAHPLASEVRA